MVSCFHTIYISVFLSNSICSKLVKKVQSSHIKLEMLKEEEESEKQLEKR
jgi:hypothetical protein